MVLLNFLNFLDVISYTKLVSEKNQDTSSAYSANWPQDHLDDDRAWFYTRWWQPVVRPLAHLQLVYLFIYLFICWFFCWRWQVVKFVAQQTLGTSFAPCCNVRLQLIKLNNDRNYVPGHFDEHRGDQQSKLYHNDTCNQYNPCPIQIPGCHMVHSSIALLQYNQ